MAYRDLTKKFKEIRSEKNDNCIIINMNSLEYKPKEYENIYESSKKVFNTIELLNKELSNLYNKYLATVFDYNNKIKIKNEIEINLKKIKNEYDKIKKYINILDKYINNSEYLHDDKKIIHNISVHLKVYLSNSYQNFSLELSEFNNKCNNRQYMINLLHNRYNIDDHLEDRMEDLTDNNDVELMLEDNKYLLEDIEENEKNIVKRSIEIENITKDIVELNEIFKDFNLLVINQGILIDRIDDNINLTFENINNGNKELEVAETYQNKSKCCGYLLIIIVIMIGLIIILALLLMTKLLLI
jgi:syntaxin 16